jgi:hypothetical protein
MYLEYNQRSHHNIHNWLRSNEYNTVTHNSYTNLVFTYVHMMLDPLWHKGRPISLLHVYHTG